MFITYISLYGISPVNGSLVSKLCDDGYNIKTKSYAIYIRW